MNLKPFLLLCLTFAVFGCVSTPKQYLTQAPIEIKAEQLNQYWQLENETFKFSLSNIDLKNISKGEIVIHYLIDSNGNIFEPKIIGSSNKDLLTRAGLKALNKMHYKKSINNPNAIPVYYTMTINFG